MNSATALIVLSGTATALCGSLGAYASSNAASGHAVILKDAAESGRERDELCIANETDAIVYYDVMWGSERRSYSLGPGMREVHHGSTMVAPFVEFGDGQMPEAAPHRVKVEPGGCDTVSYAFRYPTTSFLRRQGGIYLFGKGIEPQQYVRNDAEDEFNAIREQQLAWANERRALYGRSYRHSDTAYEMPRLSGQSADAAPVVDVSYGTSAIVVAGPARDGEAQPVPVEAPPPPPVESSPRTDGVTVAAGYSAEAVSQ